MDVAATNGLAYTKETAFESAWKRPEIGQAMLLEVVYSPPRLYSTKVVIEESVILKTFESGSNGGKNI